MTKLIFLIAASFGAVAFAMSGPPEDPTPVEIGMVKWGRDFETAKKTSAATGKPMLLLFQEVPG